VRGGNLLTAGFVSCGDFLPDSDSLDELLNRIRMADRSTRIELRDEVAAFGREAIEPMVQWLDDREFAGFAIRVLERIGRTAPNHRLVVNALAEAFPTAPSPAIASDIENALDQMGARRSSADRLGRRRASTPALPGRPGRPGRRYWAMRTSVSNPEFIWTEVRRGRLRQGWGWMEEQDLRRISERVRAGTELTPEEKAAWPARRMLGSEHDGIRYDDLVVTQNLPRQGHLSVCRVVGPYEFAVPDRPEDYGHILPVEVAVENISRHDRRVSDALRRAIGLRPRLYEITPYGGDVEELVSHSP
jgi:hypothetical protein